MKKLIIALSLFTIVLTVNAQDSIKNRRFSLQLGTSKYHYLPSVTPDGPSIYGSANVNLNLNYRISKHFSVGGYFAYMSGKSVFDSSKGSATPTYFYGLNGYYHISPYFITNESPKLDVYVKGTVGLSKLKPQAYITGYPPDFTWGAYVGVAYYPWKRLGFFGEIGYGNTSIGQLGVSFKF